MTSRCFDPWAGPPPAQILSNESYSAGKQCQGYLAEWREETDAVEAMTKLHEVLRATDGTVARHEASGR